MSGVASGGRVWRSPGSNFIFVDVDGDDVDEADVVGIGGVPGVDPPEDKEPSQAMKREFSEIL